MLLSYSKTNYLIGCCIERLCKSNRLTVVDCVIYWLDFLNSALKVINILIKDEDWNSCRKNKNECSFAFLMLFYAHQMKIFWSLKCFPFLSCNWWTKLAHWKKNHHILLNQNYNMHNFRRRRRKKIMIPKHHILVEKKYQKVWRIL